MSTANVPKSGQRVIKCDKKYVKWCKTSHLKYCVPWHTGVLFVEILLKSNDLHGTITDYTDNFKKNPWVCPLENTRSTALDFIWTWNSPRFNLTSKSLHLMIISTFQGCPHCKPVEPKRSEINDWSFQSQIFFFFFVSKKNLNKYMDKYRNT